MKYEIIFWRKLLKCIIHLNILQDIMKVRFMNIWDMEKLFIYLYKIGTWVSMRKTAKLFIITGSEINWILIIKILTVLKLKIWKVNLKYFAYLLKFFTWTNDLKIIYLDISYKVFALTTFLCQKTFFFTFFLGRTVKKMTGMKLST